jgi:hypothetical protein
VDDTDSIVSKELLPSTKLATSQFQHLLRYWRNRNLFIRDMRNMQSGLNKIEGPASSMYVIKTLHSYILAALINEKTSRYLPRPVIQTVPDDDLDDEGRAKSTRIERAVNVGGYEIERRSGGDAWDRGVLDSILLDMGVQRIQRSPNIHWKDIVSHDYALKSGETPAKSLVLHSPERIEYKKNMGVPIFKEYVPLEYYYPFFDGNDLPFAFELEEKTLWSVLNNPLYKSNEFGTKALTKLQAGPDGGLDQTVNVVQLGNSFCRAYYLAGWGPNNQKNKWPKLRPESLSYSGELELLYAYEHNLERSEYNHINGRYGGWYTDKNRIEAVGKGILELAQAADEILSQVLTNVRARYWPNLNWKMNPELRGFGTGTSKPEPPKIKEGEAIVTYIDEEILPIFKADDDPMTMWIWDTIQNQISKLGGSQTLYGQRAPGVDTGYNQAIQQTQAESLDNKQEQHIQAGAEEEALIFCLHVKKIDEEVYMHYTEEYLDESQTKRKRGKYVTLEPKDLDPIPRFSARVRKQRPVDYIAALRAAREASDDRGGKGPLLSDDTIREEILAVDGPDIEYQKILIEAQKRELIASGTITSKVSERLNIKVATQGTPQISPEMMQVADPALLQTIMETAPGTKDKGGVDPEVLAGSASRVGQPGPLPGDAMPENRLGEAVAMSEQTGGII